MLARWTVVSAPALKKCTWPSQKKDEREQILKFSTTMLNTILKHGYWRSIFLSPSLLFVQNFRSVQWVSESLESGINRYSSSIVWNQVGNERGRNSHLIWKGFLKRKVYNLLYLSSLGCTHLNITAQNLWERHPKHSTWAAWVKH